MKRYAMCLSLMAVLCGCAAAPTDKLTNPCMATFASLSANAINPRAGLPSHVASPPDNQQTFAAYPQYSYPQGCAVAAVVAPIAATWTVADTKDVSIDGNGVATCSNATNGATTVTASTTADGATQTASVALTCY